jgi:hypothetical protein
VPRLPQILDKKNGGDGFYNVGNLNKSGSFVANGRVHRNLTDPIDDLFADGVTLTPGINS